MKRSEAIKNLLKNWTHADLADLYNHEMEVQVNVAQGSGERTDREYKGKAYQAYSDGIDVWNHFRMPLDAKTEPKDNDYGITFDLAKHAEGVGMTGWNWFQRKSFWVAFDFDAITGHSDKHAKKLTDIELQEIIKIVSDIPWVTVRKSTSGKGLHLYVFINPITTSNHTEHAALARSIIGLMASLTGYDFQSKVDVCGGNMWVFHTKMRGTDGLTLIKKGEILTDIPVNWKDHVNVVNNRKRKIVPSFIDEAGSKDIETLFEELTNSRTRVPLDEDHQKVIKFLHESNAQAWWDQDNHCLVTHTIHLKEAHQKLGLKGIFKTVATGTEYGNDHNCFSSPIRRGGWVVRRFTPGVAEDATWDIDPSGYTRCYFNAEPDLRTAARACGGIEHDSGGFVFREAEVALKAAGLVGVNPEIPHWIRGRKTKLKERKDGRLLIKIEHTPNDMANEMLGWLAEGGTWNRIFSTPNTGASTEPEAGNYDDMVRHLITETGEDYGWCLKTDREWRVEPLIHIKTFLKSLNLKTTEIDQILGSCVARPWKLVTRPFQDEYLINRQWNRNAPQLRYLPTKSDNLIYPHWLKILNHIGEGLDESIKHNPWCKTHGILTGADYLKCWIASLFQFPLEPLPYLFLYSQDQNTGKTILHQAISLLMTKGVERADNALNNQAGFNAELENAILCVIEEIDLKHNKQAYNRIKDYVTAIEIQIHKKGMTPYSVLNSTHYIQTANDRQACPIFPGDSRIIMIAVPSFKEGELIPRRTLLGLLEKEAPDFLSAILNLEIPPSNDRLNLPVISTGEKELAEKANQTYLEMFLEEKCFSVTGKCIKFSDFFDKFIEWIDVNEIRNWSKKRVSAELPSQYPKGRSRSDNQLYIGNMAWEPYDGKSGVLPKFVLVNDKLETIPEQETKPIVIETGVSNASR